MTSKKNLSLLLALLLLVFSIPSAVWAQAGGLKSQEASTPPPSPYKSQGTIDPRLKEKIEALKDLKIPINADETVFLTYDPDTITLTMSGQGEIGDPYTYLLPAMGKVQEALGAIINDPIVSDLLNNNQMTEADFKALIHAIGYTDEMVFLPNLVLESSDLSFPEDSALLFSADTWGPLKSLSLPKDLDTSNVTSMRWMFKGQEYIDPDVSNWDVSKVQIMYGMFYMAKSAKPDVSKWDTSSLGTHPLGENSYPGPAAMFYGAESANPDVSNWDMSHVTYLGAMFLNAPKADPDISQWTLQEPNAKESFDPDMAFSGSGISEADIRSWDFDIDNKSYDAYLFNKTPKLQYIYMPANWKMTGTRKVMAEDFKMQRDGEAAGPIMSGSQNSYDFQPQNVNTLYFVPQTLSVQIQWEDEDQPEKTRPQDRDLTLLANGKTLDQSPKMTQITPTQITLNESNQWAGAYKGLDIFSEGEKITYSVKQDPIDDYITQIKSTHLPYKGENAYALTVRNIYKTLIEQTDPNKKPVTPENFVKVTVDTGKKASQDSQFKRTFWVTPNREVTLPVADPVGGSLAGTNYDFTGWQEMPTGMTWATGQKITAQFTQDTEILAQYDEQTSLGTGQSHPSKKALDHPAYIQGYPDLTLGPDRSITRAETATMVARLEALDLSKNKESHFTDLVPGAWYEEPVQALADKNILDGYPDGSFKPNRPISRGEFAKIVSKLNTRPKKEAKLPFQDVRGHWAEDFIQEAYLSDLITGYPDGSFKPDQAITRAEVARILNGLYERKADHKSLDLVKDAKLDFKDLPKNHWAYDDLLEATQGHKAYRRQSGSLLEDWIQLTDQSLNF
ncbi:MAG: S-layer homology domain-containing protein [Tissierellia bacterium]|nr:S-layer homology domain-containing protein [Tissierellia bacterium]